MTAAIALDRLTKMYGARAAVSDLSLAVAPGAVFGLLGPNGAGKTTTIRMLLGLIRPTSGTAAIFGRDVRTDPQAALSRVGAMVDTPALYPYLSAYDNLLALAYASGLGPAHADAALARVDLGGRSRERVGRYSQGMRQRVGIAAALLADPELIILDEPTNGLDPAGQQQIRALIRELASSGRTVVLCSHLLHDVQQLCAQVAILRDGRLVAAGDVAALLACGYAVRVRGVPERGVPERAAAVLRAGGYADAMAVADGALTLSADPTQGAAIEALLTAADIAVAEIWQREQTLEEYFLALTQE